MPLVSKNKNIISCVSLAKNPSNESNDGFLEVLYSKASGQKSSGDGKK
jgi:hypothetical protein